MGAVLLGEAGMPGFVSLCCPLCLLAVSVDKLQLLSA
jgi:hypothetical protein